MDIGRKGVEFVLCDLPRGFLAVCIYHITSHPTRQPPPPGSLGDLIRLGFCCQQLSEARSLSSLLPKQQPAFSQQQSLLEEAPWTLDFQRTGGGKELIPLASLPPGQPLGAEEGSSGLWGLPPELLSYSQRSREALSEAEDESAGGVPGELCSGAPPVSCQ